MTLLGKLSWSELPFDSSIIMVAVAFEIIAALVVLGLITYYKKWGYLWSEWLTTVDHKKIGVMYIIVALTMLLRGFVDAAMMRAQQSVAAGGNQGFLPPHHYDQFFTEHGVIMIFFVAMPLLIGLINIVVPLQIGTRDVAFPFLNAISLWLVVAAALMLNVSLAIGSFAKTGWVAYPPLAELQYSPDVGVDYYIWVLQLSGFSSLFTGINFFVTIVKHRAPGMGFMRLPIFTWTALGTVALMLIAFPLLTVALALLALDRYLGMNFFTDHLGGNAMMYVNLFWAWGHPEVYIIVLPAFGVFSEVTPTFSGKPLFAYRTMIYATAVITVLSFLVWLHHFFTMGSGADTNAFFSLMTMVIAVPTGVKVFSWAFTMYRGRVRFTVPMYWTLGFLVTFTIGGMTGVLLALPGADFLLHNSLFLIAHFHNTLIGGALFGLFAGFNYWFPKATGIKLDDKWGRRGFWFWLTGFYLAFMPLYVLGFMGMTRRMQHYDNLAWQPWLIAAGLGAVLVLFGIASMIMQLWVSFRDRERLRDTTGDPWDGRTLEWSTSSPPPFYNFARTPEVHTPDAFWTHKVGRRSEEPIEYRDIEMPKSTPAGFFIGIAGGILAFALVWHIWWAALLAVFTMFAVTVWRAYQAETEYVLPAEEVARLESLNPHHPKAILEPETVGES